MRRLAYEAAEAGLLSPEFSAGISRVKGVKQLGFRSGNWLSAQQSSEVLKHSCGETMRAKRDYAMLAMLFGCGFRRSELVGLELDDIEMCQGHWAVVDLIGKGDAASSHGRSICRRALAPSNPAAPTNTNGRQQAMLENAATTAATGVARSATLMRTSLLAFCF